MEGIRADAGSEDQGTRGDLSVYRVLLLPLAGRRVKLRDIRKDFPAAAVVMSIWKYMSFDIVSVLQNGLQALDEDGLFESIVASHA